MWALAVAVYLAAVFHRNGLAVASITAEHRFHVGPAVLSAFVAVQLGVYALMQIPSGAMADRYGSRRMLIAACALMFAGETVFAVAPDAAVALLGRGLVGLGDAVTFLSVLRLVQNWFPVTRYGMLAAATSLVGGVGQLVSTVPLHLLLVHLGWEPTFLLSAALTAALVVPVSTRLRDRPVAAPGANPTGAPATHPPLRAAVRASMAVRGTWRGMWVHFALTGPYAVFTALWGYPFLVRAEHYSPSRASAALALVVLASIAGAIPVGQLMARAPAQRETLVYFTCAALLGAWLAVLVTGPGHVPPWVVVWLLVATGIGAPASAVAFDFAREANPHERGGTATGVVNIGGFSAAVVANLVIGAVLGALGHGPGSWRYALVVVPAMPLIGLAGFWFCSRPPNKNRKRIFMHTSEPIRTITPA
ncbi:MAG: MFS transporter [Acidimicrobiales bacterium]